MDGKDKRMGVAKKGKRKLIYKDKVFFWWVGNDEEFEWEVMLHVVSEDKNIVLIYNIGDRTTPVISQGRMFQGKKSSGQWERYFYPNPFVLENLQTAPFEQVSQTCRRYITPKPPQISVTPRFVSALVAWAVDGKDAIMKI